METYTKTIIFRIKDRAVFEVPLRDEIIIGSKGTSDFCIPHISSEQCRIRLVEGKVVIQSLTDEYSTVLN